MSTEITDLKNAIKKDEQLNTVQTAKTIDVVKVTDEDEKLMQERTFLRSEIIDLFSKNTESSTLLGYKKLMHYAGMPE